MDEWFSDLHRQAEQFKRMRDEFVGAWESQIAEFARRNNHWIDALAKQASELQDWLNRLPEKTRRSLLTLSSHGWYIDNQMYMGAASVLADAFENGYAADADESLAQHFRARLPAIRQEVAGEYPHRAKYFEASFRAHDSGDYCLSIPLMLAQIDGICQEAAGDFFFIRERNGSGRPQLGRFVDSQAVPMLAATMAPLAAIGSLNASQYQINQYRAGLVNRHEVLHGTSLNYDTEMNGLRVISFLNYVVQSLRDRTRDEGEAG